MPLQRRLPKRGFRSPRAGDTAEVRLDELARVEGETIDLAALKAAGVVPAAAKRAKVILSGEARKAVHLKGIAVTVGARAALEQNGSRIES